MENKRREARAVVTGLIRHWGLEKLRQGEGVLDVGGDPGFLAAELLQQGIHVTVIDPGFGFAGKSDASTTEYLHSSEHYERVRVGVTPFRVIREPFSEDFANIPKNRKLLEAASALVSLYPDEATDFLLYWSATNGKPFAFIPCNDCAQYFPPQNPTYEGFVRRLLADDSRYCQSVQNGSMLHQVLSREYLVEAPFCRVLLQRAPARKGQDQGEGKGKGEGQASTAGGARPPQPGAGAGGRGGGRRPPHRAADAKRGRSS